MRVFKGRTNDVYARAVDAVRTEGLPTNPRGKECLEHEGPVTLSITNPYQPLVTAYGRPVNVAFALSEVVWILAGRCDVAFLQNTNSNIGQFSDDGINFNAPYGHRLRYQHGHDQLEDVITCLHEDYWSRHGSLVMADPERDRIFWDSGKKNTTLDRACNTYSHIMLREAGEAQIPCVRWLQVVRSNDLIWGVPYNFMQWMHVMWYCTQAISLLAWDKFEPMPDEFALTMDSYNHVSDSLHLYTQDYAADGGQGVEYFDLYEETGLKHKWFQTPTQERFEDLSLFIESMFQDRGNMMDFPLDDWEKSVYFICMAHRFYKEGNDVQCLKTLSRVPDRLYALAQMRFYGSMRWNKHGMEHDGIHNVIKDLVPEQTVYEWIVRA